MHTLQDKFKHRIDEVVKYIDLEHLALSRQCDFVSTVPGNRLTFEQQTAKLQLVVEVAREIWG